MRERKVSPEETMSFLKFIVNAKKQCNVESYISIKNAIDMFSIPLSRIILKKGTILFRGRVNKNERFISDVQIGAINTPNLILDFGRANEPLKSLFYCSDNYYTACMETSALARLKSNQNVETITVGCWEVVEDLIIASIPSNPDIKGLNKTVDGLQTSFEELVALYRDETTNMTLEVLNIFSKEFTRDAHGNPNNYLISCAFANYYFENLVYDSELKKEIFIDGILYPSAMLRTEGVNLALTYDTYYSGKLKLVKAIEKRMNKIGENIYQDDIWIESKSVEQNSGEIIW